MTEFTEFESIQKCYDDKYYKTCLYNLTIFCEHLKDNKINDEQYIHLYHKALSLYQQCYTNHIRLGTSMFEISSKYNILIENDNSFALNLFANFTSDLYARNYIYKLSAKKKNPFALYNLYQHGTDIDTNKKNQYLLECADQNCHLGLLELIKKNIYNDINKAIIYYNILQKYYSNNMNDVIELSLGKTNITKLQLYKKISDIENNPNINDKIKKELWDDYELITTDEPTVSAVPCSTNINGQVIGSSFNTINNITGTLTLPNNYINGTLTTTGNTIYIGNQSATTTTLSNMTFVL